MSVGCSALQINAGLCSITPSTTDTAVVLEGTIPGGDAPPIDSGSSSGGDSSGGFRDDSTSDPTTAGPPCLPVAVVPHSCLGGPGGPGDPVSAAPTVTIADVATFVPTMSVGTSEPAGWALVGLPVNLIGPSGAVTVDGVLLGAGAQVRFTPIAWHWEFGDGTAASRPVPGGSWASLGLAEFSTTPTSHVYASSGTVRVTLTVELAAEYRIAEGPWSSVQGALTVPVPPFDLIVASAETVLVDRGCDAAPTGPGC
jgi:hypothetical protein